MAIRRKDLRLVTKPAGIALRHPALPKREQPEFKSTAHIFFPTRLTKAARVYGTYRDHRENSELMIKRQRRCERKRKQIESRWRMQAARNLAKQPLWWKLVFGMVLLPVLLSMARLPTVGGDTDNWGNILNPYLLVAHTADGHHHGLQFNVEDDPYNAVPDVFFQDGVSNATTTFTSATANFNTGTDAGKQIVMLKSGASSGQDWHTTIASVTNSTTVVLTNATLRSQSGVRFYVNRNTTNTANITAFQAAVDAAAAAGGGIVFATGVGYTVSDTLVLKNRVWIVFGPRTLYHLIGSVNKKVIKCDDTLNNSATNCGIFNGQIDGNRDRQNSRLITPTIATTAYTAGNGTMVLSSTAGLDSSGWGYFTVGGVTNRFIYQGISGSSLTGVTDQQENSSSIGAAIGTTINFNMTDGVVFNRNPFNSGGSIEEEYDPHHVMRDVKIKNVGGIGLVAWGQSEARWDNVWINYADEIAFRPSYDHWMANCTADGPGRFGFVVRGSSAQGVNLKAFFCGGNVPQDGWGFLFEGYTGLEPGTKTYNSCNAQDNKAGGYLFKNTQGVQVAGTADSNGSYYQGTFTVTIASPAVVTKSNHGLQVGDRIYFLTSGALPTGLAIDTPYYVIATGFGTNSFEVSTTPGGAAVNTSGTQSGTHQFAGGTYEAIRIIGTGSAGNICCDINIQCTDRYGTTSSTMTQRHALHINDAGVAQNTIRIKHKAGSSSNGAGGFILAPVTPNSVLTGGNTLQINGEGATITPAFAASYTPDPYAATTHKIGNLTANITINAPAPYFHFGQKIEIILRQDGTGGRTITWNAIFLNTPASNTGANAFTTARFIYDGTNWVGME